MSDLDRTRSLIRELVDDMFSEEGNVEPLYYFAATIVRDNQFRHLPRLPSLAQVGQYLRVGGDNEEVQVVSRVDNVCVLAKIASQPFASLSDNSFLLTQFTAPVFSLLYMDDPPTLSHVCFVEPYTYVDLGDGTLTFASSISEDEDDDDNYSNICQ